MPNAYGYAVAAAVGLVLKTEMLERADEAAVAFVGHLKVLSEHFGDNIEPGEWADIQEKMRKAIADGMKLAAIDALEVVKARNKEA